MENIEQLLKPRYKVIAEDTSNRWTKGDIITFSEKEIWFTGVLDWVSDPYKGSIFSIKILEPHPHLFRKLEWWENRKPEEMPEYVKSMSGVSVRKVQVFQLHWNKVILDGGKIRSVKQWLPATATEYNQYLKQKQ